MARKKDQYLEVLRKAKASVKSTKRVAREYYDVWTPNLNESYPFITKPTPTRRSPTGVVIDVYTNPGSVSYPNLGYGMYNKRDIRCTNPTYWEYGFGVPASIKGVNYDLRWKSMDRKTTKRLKAPYEPEDFYCLPGGIIKRK